MRPRALTGTALAAAIALTSAAETYRGIDVAPEHRCAPYDRGDYRYSQSLEPRIVASIGKVYGPYTGTCFQSMAETDIEHMVATSEAHDSGLCAAPRSVKAAFASDLLNLTLASPGVNLRPGFWRGISASATTAAHARRPPNPGPSPRDTRWTPSA